MKVRKKKAICSISKIVQMDLQCESMFTGGKENVDNVKQDGDQHLCKTVRHVVSLPSLYIIL